MGVVQAGARGLVAAMAVTGGGVTGRWMVTAGEDRLGRVGQGHADLAILVKAGGRPHGGR
jgi:hypothetical protein